jgi:hypothetical protein
MTHVFMIQDPVYLSEPLVKSNGFMYAPNGDMTPYPCHTAVEVPRPFGAVPHYFMGQNPYLKEYAEKYHVPFEATRGGAETALPEFMQKVKPAGKEAAK